MKIDAKVYGSEEAKAMMDFLQRCGAQAVGAVLHGKEREGEGLNNADVIEYLREGVTRADGTVVQRDLGPTQADADGASKLYVTQVAAMLRKLSAASGPSAGKVVSKAQSAKLAESANSSGLLMGARSVAEKMRKRAEDQLTVHTGSETQARSVEETYARRRSKLFGVPGSVVYRASGQLLRNLAPGNVRLVRAGGLLSSWRTLLGR